MQQFHKLMEHVMLHCLNKTSDKVLRHRQHAFRKGFSRQTQLCATYNDLATASNDGHLTHATAIVIDLNKVPHVSLL